MSQLIHRPGAQTYKDDLLAKFVPRALSQTHLKNTQIEHSIQQQIKNRNYQSALQTLSSAERTLKTDDYIPQQFKQVFNQNSNNEQLVLATRKIFQGLTETFDGLLTQRLSTVMNLLTSLFTTLIESLRLKLQEFDAKHTLGEEELLRITGATLTGIETCLPPDFGGLYSCLGALIALIALVFPGLVILRNSLTNYATKLQGTQVASTLRKFQRDNLVKPPGSSPVTKDTQDGAISRPHANLQTRTLMREDSLEPGTDGSGFKRLGKTSEFPREYAIQLQEAAPLLPVPTLRRNIPVLSQE